jgi:arabinose-5-phosphate isomerase
MQKQITTGATVIRQEARGLQALASKLDAEFGRALDLLDVEGKIVMSGVGKSGHVCRKLAATFTSLGRHAIFIHSSEAAHGDMARIRPGKDAILALSRSGKAKELQPIMDFASDRNIPIVLVSENHQSGLASFADAIIKLPRIEEAWGHAPTTSTTMQMAVGDAIAVCLAERHGWTEKDFRAHHPGGALGSVA